MRFPPLLHLTRILLRRWNNYPNEKSCYKCGLSKPVPKPAAKPKPGINNMWEGKGHLTKVSVSAGVNKDFKAPTAKAQTVTVQTSPEEQKKMDSILFGMYGSGGGSEWPGATAVWRDWNMGCPYIDRGFYIHI